MEGYYDSSADAGDVGLEYGAIGIMHVVRRSNPLSHTSELSLDDCILSTELREQFRRGATKSDNGANYAADLLDGKLNRFMPSYAVYSEGVFCGAGKDFAKLAEMVATLYGAGNFDIYLVKASEPVDENTTDQINIQFS